MVPLGNALSPRVNTVPANVSRIAAVPSSLVPPQVAMLPATRITSAGSGTEGSKGASLPPPHPVAAMTVPASKAEGNQCLMNMTLLLTGELLLGGNERTSAQQRVGL